MGKSQEEYDAAVKGASQLLVDAAHSLVAVFVAATGRLPQITVTSAKEGERGVVVNVELHLKENE